MGTQSVRNLDTANLCNEVDEWLSCQGRRYVRYDRYKIGEKPDISHAIKMERLRRSLCESDCGLCPDEVMLLRERINKLLL